MGQLQDGNLKGITQVHNLIDGLFLANSQQNPLHQIINITETSGLAAVAIDGDGLVTETLGYEIGDNPAIIEPHARTVGVKDADNSEGQLVLMVIGHGQGFGEPLSFIITASGPHWINISVVVLPLGTGVGIAVNLRGRSHYDPGLVLPGQLQHIGSTSGINQKGLNGKIGIVDGTGRAGQMKNEIHLSLIGFCDIMFHQSKIGATFQMGHVVRCAGNKVIQADHLVTPIHQAVAQMRADKTGSAGN
ncbi:MAG: hypothetical protein DDT18_01314 [Actinobacteria bacterium]|nr:hypothetical protein [Actinomycetota bacterium]